MAAELFKLSQAAEAGSDEQFQLITAYLGYGEPDDAAFEANPKGLRDGSVKLDGLEIDNNFRWTIINALSAINAISQSDIDAELAKRETTENREFALGARAVAGTAEAKEWAWNEALHNDELTNMQLESVARGFASTPRRGRGSQGPPGSSGRRPERCGRNFPPYRGCTPAVSAPA